MAKCSKCDASVPEQKAFCPECGAPMSAQASERKQSAADLGATVIVPPSQWKTPPTPATGGTTPTPTPTPTAPPAAATPSAPPPTSAPAATPKPLRLRLSRHGLRRLLRLRRPLRLRRCRKGAARRSGCSSA